MTMVHRLPPSPPDLVPPGPTVGPLPVPILDLLHAPPRSDIGGSKGGGQGPPPKGLTKINEKMAQFATFCIIRKKFSHGACPQTPLIRYLRRIFGTKIGTMPVEARALSQKKIVSQIMPLTLKSIEKCHKA